MVMAAKLTRLTHKIAIQLHLVAETVPFAVLAPGGQSGNFWIHGRIHPLMNLCSHERFTTINRYFTIYFGRFRS